jgi:hypothetical protein
MPELPPPREARCPAAGNMRSEQIIPSVVDCTRPIADVRTLRAAAFAPYVLGLTLFVVAVPLSYASGNERGAAQFLAGSLALFVTARLIKRGSLIATVALATSLIGLVMSLLVGLAHETRVEDILVGLLGFVTGIELSLIPCSPPNMFLEMFRRTLPNATSRNCLARLSNRLTKIIAETRKLHTP